MVTVAEFWHELSAHFPPNAVSWRVGVSNIDKQTNQPRNGKEPVGLGLAYIDARDVMERLDAVCGPAGWECSYPHANGKTVCEIRCWVPRGAPTDDIKDCEWAWVSKADGAGDTDFEADKGALSDAFKRAAVRFGVGRYLYGVQAPWYPIEQAGKSWQFTRESYGKLENLLRGLAQDAGTNQERVALRLLCKAVDYMPTPETIMRFQEDRKSEIHALSVANREAFKSFLDSKIARMKEKAA